MQIYLPIAELSLNVFYLAGIGGVVGFLSGLFGVGGGFLLTPLLIFSGIPTPVAVASVTGQVVAASTSGALSYWRRGGIDLHLALYLVVSGIIGTLGGVATFTALRALGQLDLIISLSYVVLLGSVGGLMLNESARALLKRKRGFVEREKLPHQHNWVHGLPLRTRFKRSKLYISILPILVIGATIGFLGSMLGIGGGFILVPALVYILRVPGNMVIGTSLVQVLSIMAASTILHAVNSQSVDMLLAFCLMVGGVVGAQFGVAAGRHLRGEQLRALLALLILVIALRFAVGLTIPPTDVFSTTVFGVTGG